MCEDINKTSLATIVLVIVLLTSAYFAHQWDTDFGRLRTEVLRIPDGELTLSAILHIPLEASPANPRPAVAVTHGISSTKDMVDSISLELARRGFITLTLDLHGHGDSEGRLGSSDASFGLQAAADYLRSRPDTDPRLIGVAGHSLGAGAARVVASGEGIWATALIAGGLGGYNQEGALTATNPRNLLIAVGSHDVLFEMESLLIDLEPIFGGVLVEPGIIYGDPSVGTARKLAVKPTTHLLEPMDPGLVSEVVDWFMEVFAPGERSLEQNNVVFLWREVSLLGIVASLFGLTLLAPRYLPSSIGIRRNVGEKTGYLTNKRVLLLWSLPGILLFFPVMALGTFIPFPPQLFGSSMAWWLLGYALAGLLLLRLSPSHSWKRHDLKKCLMSSITRGELILSLGLVSGLYLMTTIMEYSINLSPRFFVPILTSLTVRNRMLVLPTYLPFFITYFLVDGLFLFKLRQSTERGFNELANALRIKLLPFILVVGSQYIGMYLLNIRVFPGYLGFMLEFMLGVIPLLAISTVSSWWLHRTSGRIGLGALFNTFLFAWIASSLFPFGSIG
jgi:pimeloyl-ACP methyl ester carboxylesterase